MAPRTEFKADSVLAVYFLIDLNSILHYSFLSLRCANNPRTNPINPPKIKMMKLPKASTPSLY